MKLKYYLVKKTMKKAMKIYNCIDSYQEEINYCKACNLLLSYVIYINLKKEIGYNKTIQQNLIQFFKTELNQSWYARLLKKDMMKNVFILWRVNA